jgi:hypothetical protein
MINQLKARQLVAIVKQSTEKHHSTLNEIQTPQTAFTSSKLFLILYYFFTFINLEISLRQNLQKLTGKYIFFKFYIRLTFLFKLFAKLDLKMENKYKNCLECNIVGSYLFALDKFKMLYS